MSDESLTEGLDEDSGGPEEAGGEGLSETEHERILGGVSPRQEKALIALMNEPTIARAADMAGVGERTLHTWIDEPVFKAAYRRARRRCFEQAIAMTQRYASLAVQCLAKVITDPSASHTARVSAATSLLRFGREGIELEDLAERVEALESAQQREREFQVGAAA